jgi:hypothetical protein
VRFFAPKFIPVILVLVSSLICERSFAQVKQDSSIVLINNVAMQIEISDALNDLYNFKFAKAEQQFRWFKQKYEWHPLPYFLLGLSEWWKIMPNTKETKYDDRFIAYMEAAEPEPEVGRVDDAGTTSREDEPANAEA